MLNNEEQRKTEKKETRKIFEKCFSDNNIEYTEYTDEQAEDYIQKWFIEFAPNKRINEARKVCFSNKEYNCYLWHLFSYNFLKSVEGVEAIKKYQSINKRKCIIMLDFEGMCFEVENINLIDIDFINTINNIYITDPDFNWCYVHTHESFLCSDGNYYIGPYFYQKQF